MRKLLLIFCFMCFVSAVKAQSDTITSRDTLEFIHLIKNYIIPDYQSLLNFIANTETGQNEVERIVENRVKGNSESKLFFNDKVIIDNDLNPGADKDKVLRGEMEVGTYLFNFHSNYAKSDESTILFTVKKISSLKKKNYLFEIKMSFQIKYNNKI